MDLSLLGCVNKHYWVSKRERDYANTYGFTYQISNCPICGLAQQSVIRYISLPLKPNNYIAYKFTVPTFSKRYSMSQYDLKTYKRDRILTLLEANNISIVLSDDNDSRYIVNDRFAFFVTKSHRLTSDLYMFVPKDDPILSELSKAIKLDRKDAARLRGPKPPKIKVESMEDIIGNQLMIGDWIAYVCCNIMYIGQIEKFTEKSMTVHDMKGKSKSSVKSKASSLLSKDQMLIYKLSNN